MLCDLKQHYWWCEMKKDISNFVVICLNYQQVKYEHQRLMIRDHMTFMTLKT